MELSSQLGKYASEILSFYIPLLLEIPQLRDNPDNMAETVKATGKAGITDVATKVDVYVQKRIREHVTRLHPDWVFWGEESGANQAPKSTRARYMLITDPIEGTNNFKYRKDNLWGSVIAVVEMATKEPVIGMVAQIMKKRLFLGIRGEGAYTLDYGNGSVTSASGLVEPDPSFTYNNSPHFEPHLLRQVEKFYALGKMLPGKDNADEIDRSRKSVELEERVFVDVECGALEPILFSGGIMFKTNLEVAAAFAILGEAGGKVTDAKGMPWSLKTNSLIFARKTRDWEFLKKLYDKTR